MCLCFESTDLILMLKNISSFTLRYEIETTCPLRVHWSHWYPILPIFFQAFLPLK